MTNLLVFALLGLGGGALIAGMALALNLQFQGAGVINLGTGAVATFGAYSFYCLRTQGELFALVKIPLGGNLPTVPALIVTLILCVAMGMLVDAFLFRPLRTAPALAKLIASLGLLLTLQSVFVLQFGTNGNVAPQILPDSSNDSINVGGTPIPMDRIELAIFVIVVGLLLTLAYRFTKFGLSTRAAAEAETDAMLAGISPNRLSLINTSLAFLIAGALGALAAPTTQLDPTTIPLAVVPALAAALLARFRSFPIAVIAGLAMGIVQSLLIYLQTLSWFPTMGGNQLPGVDSLFFFLAVLVALAFTGSKLPSRGALIEKRLPPAPEPRRIALSSSVMLVIGVIALMVFPADFRQATIVTMVGFVICLSMVVIIGYVGQVSLIQVALAGVGAFATAHFSIEAGLGFPLPVILAILTGVLFGVVSGVPALRVRGVNLAILTLAGAVALEQFVFNNSTIGENTLEPPIPAIHFWGINLSPSANFPLWDGKQPSPAFGLVLLLVAVGLGAFVAGVRRSTFGSQLLAVRSNERAAAAAGIDVRVVKISAFVLAAAIAAIAGVFYAYDVGTVTTDEFGLVSALGFVAFAYMGGMTTILGAIFGATFVNGSISAYALQKWTGLNNNVLLLIGGVSLMVYVVMYPRGMALATEEQVRGWMVKLRSLRSVPLQPSADPANALVTGQNDSEHA